MKDFWDGFEKQAAEKTKPSAREDAKPGYWARRSGVVRASSDKNLGGIIGIENNDLIGALVTKGLGHGLVGAASGAAAGGLAGALSRGKVSPRLATAIGGLLGYSIGSAHGSYQARKKYLADKGINLKYLGLDSEFSPEAQKKYIDAYKKK